MRSKILGVALSTVVEATDKTLQEAVELMVKVARGERTVSEMGQWISTHFPEHRDRLPESMRADSSVR